MFTLYFTQNLQELVAIGLRKSSVIGFAILNVIKPTKTIMIARIPPQSTNSAKQIFTSARGQRGMVLLMVLNRGP